MFGITIADYCCLCSTSTVVLLKCHFFSASALSCALYYTHTLLTLLLPLQLLCTLTYSYEQLPAGASQAERVEFVMADLKAGLEGMARALFGDVEMRWVDAYFPFTDPSAELEIFFGVSMT
jgi:phenylalanyl-tRNA synthetase alpha subunit